MSVFSLSNYQNFKIFFTFLLLWFSVQFGDFIEDVVAYFLVITLGILHGANDLLIISKNDKRKQQFYKNLSIYITIIVICLLIYLFKPMLAILLFIIISAYHFGEEHLSELVDISKYFNFFYYISYGGLIFSIIFFNSLNDVNQILDQLVGGSFTKNQITFSLSFSLLIFLLTNSYLLIAKKIDAKQLLKELFYLLLLSLVFKSTSLILGFAIYFILWHSLPSIIHQVVFISGNFSKKSIWFYIKQAFIYWVISILSMLILYIFIPQLEQFSIVVFVILFAVTAPHVWVMHRMKN